jgi:hypothetical protein
LNYNSSTTTFNKSDGQLTALKFKKENKERQRRNKKQTNRQTLGEKGASSVLFF